MKLKDKLTGIYGLRARFRMTLLMSGLVAVIAFCISYYSVDALVNTYFVKSDFEHTHLERQVESLQDYITENGINRSNLSELAAWEKRQPLILLEFYDDMDLIYSSYYHNRSKYVNYVGSNSIMFEGNNVFSIRLGDTTVTAIIYSNFAYRYHFLDLCISLLIAAAIFIFLCSKAINRVIGQICRLENDIQILEGGNLEYEVPVQGNDELADLAESVDRMRLSFREQLQTEQELYQSHAKLITEMSHDLRTPLTSLMLYCEILKFHRCENKEEELVYLDKIDAKAHLLKQLTDHLFEYTLDGNTPKLQELSEIRRVLCTSVANLCDELEQHGFTVQKSLEWMPGYIQIKTEYLNRILENIVSNINRYAEKDVPVQVETVYQGTYCGLAVSNTIAAQPDRTDSRRIGIKSIRTMMSQMGGTCTVEQTDTFFEITILFLKQ